MFTVQTNFLRVHRNVCLGLLLLSVFYGWSNDIVRKLLLPPHCPEGSLDFMTPALLYTHRPPIYSPSPSRLHHHHHHHRHRHLHQHHDFFVYDGLFPISYVLAPSINLLLLQLNTVTNSACCKKPSLGDNLLFTCSFSGFYSSLEQTCPLFI